MNMQKTKPVISNLSLRCLAMLACLVWLAVSASAQTFNSGSTGADGAFSPTANVTVTLPASGVLNYTTVNIPAGVTVTFTRNAANTPVTILASGNVTIAGTISVNGGLAVNFTGGPGGPGGFNGGDGGLGTLDRAGKNGDGPGGGGGGQSPSSASGGQGGIGAYLTTAGSTATAPDGAHGLTYGSATLLPLLGGSGGGGGAGRTTWGGGGGGGGGAILIASSGTISFTSAAKILANTGGGTLAGTPNASGGAGSGGAVRLVATTLTGSPRIEVIGKSTFGNEGSGYVRAEAFDRTAFSPVIPTVYITYSLPNPITLPNNPQLAIVSVGGINSPANSQGSFSLQPDIVVPTTVANPVTVNLQAAELPVGTVIQVTVRQENGLRTTVNSTPLTGSQASSTATASVTLPTTGIVVISANVTLNVLIAYQTPLFIDGERIDKVEIAAAFGGASEVTYISQTGRRMRWLH